MLTEILRIKKKKKNHRFLSLRLTSKKSLWAIMVWRIGNTLCKGNGTSDAADPFGSSDLFEEQQHTALSFPTQKH